MSENLDLVRSIVAYWERGDFSRADWADPEIDYVFPDGLLPGSWTGLEELKSGFRDWLAVWEGARYEATAFRELDPDSVLVLARYRGRGKTSGLEMEQLGQLASVFHLQGGKVTRLIVYLKAENALAELGLAPEGDSS